MIVYLLFWIRVHSSLLALRGKVITQCYESAGPRAPTTQVSSHNLSSPSPMTFFCSRSLLVCKTVDVNRQEHYIKFQKSVLIFFLTQKLCRCSQTIQLPTFPWGVFLITLKSSLNLRKVCPIAVQCSSSCSGLLQTLNSLPLPDPSLLVPLQPLTNDWWETFCFKHTLSHPLSSIPH